MLLHGRSDGDHIVGAVARLIRNIGFAASDTTVTSSTRARIRCTLSFLKTVTDTLLVLSLVEELPADVACAKILSTF